MHKVFGLKVHEAFIGICEELIRSREAGMDGKTYTKRIWMHEIAKSLYPFYEHRFCDSYYSVFDATQT